MPQRFVDDTAMLEAAIALAVEKHAGQRDKAGAPYILHPLRIMLRFDGAVERAVAILHDVAEDCGVSLADLRERGFPDAVIDGVDAMTRRAGESYDAFVTRASANPVARRVKLADIEDNLDIRRLAEIGDGDVARLRKYLRARDRLSRAPGDEAAS